MPLDYETLRLIWWFFLAVLLAGFAVLDGFDLGVAAQLPLVARTDTERRIAINSIAPVWDGNQVWFILGGGAVFAAFPLLYATAFSGFYAAMFLVLLTFIVRPVGFDFRNKVADPRWRRTWDAALSTGGALAAVLFGVAVGNLFLGVPFEFDSDLRLIYHGGLLGLLRPFPILCGVVSLAMLLMHGAAYLGLKTEGAVANRSRRVLMISAGAIVALLVIGGFWTGRGIDGFVVTAGIDPDAPSNPLAKTVMREAGAWLANYGRHGWMVVAPVLAIGGPVAALLAAWRRRPVAAFLASACTVLAIIFTAGFSLFPFLLPSDYAPNASLTIWDASSSRHTLFIMLIATLIFLPLVGIYTAWAYRVLRGKVTEAYIRENEHSLY